MPKHAVWPEKKRTGSESAPDLARIENGNRNQFATRTRLVILLNFVEYREPNPFIRSIEGAPRVGERLTATIQPPGGAAAKFRPIVLVATPNREFRWRGRLLLPGLFTGEHHFQLVPLAQDQTRFIQGEKFSGLLVPLAKSMLEGKTKAGFIVMNQALKSRAEGLER